MFVCVCVNSESEYCKEDGQYPKRVFQRGGLFCVCVCVLKKTIFFSLKKTRKNNLKKSRGVILTHTHTHEDILLTPYSLPQTQK